MKRNKSPFLCRRRRRIRLDDAARGLRESAAEQWDELFLRFRPVISAVFSSVHSLHEDARKPSSADVVNVLTRKLEDLIIKEKENGCFADLLWRALESAAHPHQAVIQNLKAKLYFRSVIDDCPSAAEVGIIEMLGYLRSEGRDPASVEKLTDLEFDKLRKACDVVGVYFRTLGTELDRLTKDVLCSRQLQDDPPRRIILAWIK